MTPAKPATRLDSLSLSSSYDRRTVPMTRPALLAAALHVAVVLGAVVFGATAAGAQTQFAARLDASQVLSNPSSSTATGLARMTLNAEQTELAYFLEFDGLDLKPLAAERTEPDDIVAIHIHLNVPGVIGPHVLNIFGFPAEEDGDRVVDYENETITGVYDASDATRNPDTGEIEPQAFPLTTKLFPTPTRLAELLNEEWYFAVHTVGNAATPPGVTIRGNFVLVPEPTAALLAALGMTAMCRTRQS